jgi:hypothetical protein
MAPELDGMTATLPAATRNMFVDGEYKFIPYSEVADASQKYAAYGSMLRVECEVIAHLVTYLTG